MARVPFSQISANIRRPNQELSPATRGEIIGRAAAGQKQAAIARVTGVPKQTVFDTINKAP